MRTINNLREKMNDDKFYAFQKAAILEATHELPAAIGEYVKSFDANENEDFSQSYRAKNRLTTLAGRKEENLRLINEAFQTERKRRTDDSILVLAYADFLHEAKQKTQAEMILKQEISGSTNKEFLESAREFFSSNDNKTGEQIALRRLGQTASNPRGAISCKLQLADSFLEENRRDEAKNVVSELLAKFPANYGVLSESADIYWRINAREDAIRVLQNGEDRGKGKFKYIFSRKLAAKLVLQNRYDSAEQILLKLHNEDAGDTEVFRELTNIYVNQKKSDELKKVFGETLKALKNQDIERRELNAQIAEFRTQLIGSFTQVKDYGAAVEQHIEIINREPDGEESVENAINYVKRYGGGETLLAYYQKTASEAYKNYRWNVVLARIFEANNDLENAVRNYRTAIENQPEMPELYAALAEIETRRKNYDAAVENINKILELTNGDAQYIKLKIKVLEKAGRNEEAETERAKLPVEERPKLTLSDQFQEARNLHSTEKSNSAAYRQAFEELFQNPLAHDLTAADVAGYVSAARTKENLDAIAGKLWDLREKFIAEADGSNLINAGKARKQLQILDGAMPEAIGNIAKTAATSDENSALQIDLSRRIDEVFQKTDRHSTLSLVQNIVYRVGLGALTEKILTARKDADFVYGNAENYYNRLRELINFYQTRGMYQKILDVLETERSRDKSNAKFYYSQLIAENARLVGDSEKELNALRENYQSASGKITAEPNEMTARYLEFLYQNKREELGNLTKKYSPHQLQLINFLLAKGEGSLAHEAIENSELAKSWKLARNAETSLALREYSGKNECYFCDALQLAPIGEFIKQRPDKNAELVGDEWFYLTGEYGKWLYFAPNAELKTDAKNFLPAMTENSSNSADAQANLGAFYLAQKDAKNALEHLKIALEINPDAAAVKANLGAVYFQAGDEKKARKVWTKIIADEDPDIEDGELYLQTLSKYGLQTEARENLLPIIVKNLKENDEGNNDHYYQEKKDKLPENLKNLIRKLSESFDSETAKNDYFQKLVSAVSNNILLPEMLINESLITENNRTPFYEILIARSEISSSSDYEYEAVLQRTYSAEEAEEIYDSENDFKVTQPENERVNWQKKYLEYLLETNKNAKSQTLISLIEGELNRRYARPEWLRLAEMKVQIRQGNLAKTLEDTKRFIGIEIKSDAQTVKPPSIGRLNDVLQILRDEKHSTEAGNLLRSFYLRQLALEQYVTPAFIGLAQIYFEENKPENAFEILRILNESADENIKTEALAKLAALPQIKIFAIDEAKSEETKTNYSINKKNALVLSAGTCANFNQIESAIAFRQKLIEIAPEDAKNQIELARLFARNNNQTETVKLLADVINNRNADKDLRWQAVWMSREIVENKADLFNNLQPAEGEARNALEILINNGIEIKVENPGSHFWFFVGLIAKEFRQNNYAMNAFQNSLIADTELQNPFGEENAAQMMMRLYVVKNQPNAAFRLADTDKAAKSDELSSLLSAAAEKVGDFGRAIDFEKAKSKNIDAEKIARLQNLNEEEMRKVTDFAVNLENTR